MNHCVTWGSFQVSAGLTPGTRSRLLVIWKTGQYRKLRPQGSPRVSCASRISRLAVEVEGHAFLKRILLGQYAVVNINDLVFALYIYRARSRFTSN
jgi:hypothetical protein